MKLGEIKLEALRLMRAARPGELYLENLVRLEDDDTVADYLSGIPGALNRAFSDLEARGVLPGKRAVILSGEGEEGLVRINLKEKIPDIYCLVKLTLDNDGFYHPYYSFVREGEEIIVRIPGGVYEIAAIYKPRIERIFSFTPDDVEIALPDELCALLPYFIKSELYSEEEPDDAAKAREYYDEGVILLTREREEGLGKVHSKYSFCEVVGNE